MKMNTTLPSTPYNINYYSTTIKTRFAMKFLQAIKRLQQKKGKGRYRAVRDAARTSMASAVGPGRAWSRAVLRKRRNYKELRCRRIPSTSPSPSPSTSSRENEQQQEELRGVVPGGEEMGFCSLLSETAHYIICLQAQVQVMTDILHASSSSS